VNIVLNRGPVRRRILIAEHFHFYLGISGSRENVGN
jgi:hypothetical protein